MFESLFTRKPPTSADAAALVARLQQKHTVALADFDRARASHADASLDVETNVDGGAAALEKSRQAVSKAEQRYLDIDGGLNAAKAAHARAVAAEERQALAARWDEAERNGKAYTSALRALGESSAKAAADYRAAQTAGAAFAASLPAHRRPDLQQAVLADETLKNGFRKELRRGGIVWSWPMDVDNQPIEQLASDAEVLIAQRPAGE